MRLIDADYLDEKMGRLANRYALIGKKETARYYNFVRTVLETAPTMDAEIVVHGEWSTIEDDYCGLVALHCSVCNNEWWFEEDAPIKHYHYCPNCGAKMDGGNEDV